MFEVFSSLSLLRVLKLFPGIQHRVLLIKDTMAEWLQLKVFRDPALLRSKAGHGRAWQSMWQGRQISQDCQLLARIHVKPCSLRMTSRIDRSCDILWFSALLNSVFTDLQMNVIDQEDIPELLEHINKRIEGL